LAQTPSRQAIAEKDTRGAKHASASTIIQDESFDADGSFDSETAEGENDADFDSEWSPLSCGWRGMPCLGVNAPFADRLWVRGEYLLWWTRGSNVPPLVTTSPANTDPSIAGVLGQSGTSVLFDGDSSNAGAQSGGRITLGYWFVPCEWNGIGASYLNLSKQSNRFSADSDTTPVLARPFFDLQNNSQSALLVAHPNFLQGSVAADMSLDLQVYDAFVRGVLVQREHDRLDLLVGYRYGLMHDNFSISQSSRWTKAQGIIPAGTTKSLFDAFDATNEFQGAEIGLAYEEHIGRWSLEVLMKLGVGNNRSRMAIDGQTLTTVPNVGSATFVGGLLAQSTNIGQYEQNEFAILPEIGITAGYDLTNRLRATMGYTFLYWNKVARSTDQIDLNLSQLPPEEPAGERHPAFNFATSNFWAQGMNFGLEYRF
jgi:hypothetical protein